MAEVFDRSDYRAILKEKLRDSSEKEWGSISRFADSIGVQRSHVSRVLSGQKDLTPEQAVASAEFFRFTDSETDYFLLLVELARAGTPAYKARIQKKLQQIRKEREDLSRKHGFDRIGIEEKEALYYSAWYWSAIHILISIGDFQTPERIAEKLQLPRTLVENCLARLEELGLAKKERGRWSTASTTIFLPKHSPLTALHHQNWRQRAVIDAQAFDEKSVHYTVVQSLSRADFEKLRVAMLKTIDDFIRIAEPSKPEELVSFTCDFYRL